MPECLVMPQCLMTSEPPNAGATMDAWQCREIMPMLDSANAYSAELVCCGHRRCRRDHGSCESQWSHQTLAVSPGCRKCLQSWRNNILLKGATPPDQAAHRSPARFQDLRHHQAACQARRFHAPPSATAAGGSAKARSVEHGRSSRH